MYVFLYSHFKLFNLLFAGRPYQICICISCRKKLELPWTTYGSKDTAAVISWVLCSTYIMETGYVEVQTKIRHSSFSNSTIILRVINILRVFVILYRQWCWSWNRLILWILFESIHPFRWQCLPGKIQQGITLVPFLILLQAIKWLLLILTFLGECS